ncbi:hypothetical protein F5H01DRAFT_339176 [Linnemannia elongata]|nr:hypothetical protein F5H01DRAFT_339176 [Linnemannia elongata]
MTGIALFFFFLFVFSPLLRREGDRSKEKIGDPHPSIQCPLHHSEIPAPKKDAQCIMHFVDNDCTCSVRNGVNRVFEQYICRCMHIFTCCSTLTKEYIQEGYSFHLERLKGKAEQYTPLLWLRQR